MIGHKEEGTFLHHYTSVDKAICMLDSGQIWLSPMSNVNDPKEFSDWDLMYYRNRDQDLLSTKDWEKISKDISYESKRISKIACFTQDTTTNFDSPYLRYVQSGCIGRGFANSPMWNFYGEQHKGCCLMFDKRRLINEFEEQTTEYTSYNNAIKYKDEQFARNVGFEPYYFVYDDLRACNCNVREYTKGFLAKRFKDLYFIKQTVWDYEKEYRFYVLDDSDTPFKLNFGNSLSYICFGVECSEDDKNKIMKFTKKHKFQTREIEFKNHTIQLKMQ